MKIFKLLTGIILISVVAFGAAKIGENILRIGDKTGSDIEIKLGNGAIKWNTSSSAIQFSNDGLAFSDMVSSTGAGAGAEGVADSLHMLIEHQEVKESAYAAGLSVSNGASSTVDGYFFTTATGISVRGLAEFTTNLVWQISLIGTGDVDTSDLINKSGELLQNDTVKVFRKVILDGIETFIDTGILKTLTGNASNAAGVTTIPLDETSLQVGDVLYHSTQISKTVSLVAIGVGSSFVDMERNAVEVLSFEDSGALANPGGTWVDGTLTGILPDGTGSNDLTINGTLVAGTPLNAPNSLKGFDGSNYLDNSTNQRFKIMSTNWSWSFWFKPVSSANASLVLGVLEQGGVDGDTEGWRVTVDSGTVLKFFTNGAGGASLDMSYTDSVWMHIVVTFNNSTSDFKVYKNAVLINTRNGPVNDVVSTGGFTFGSRGGGTNSIGTGSEYEAVQRYERVLDGGEITTLYNSGAGIPFRIQELSVREEYTKQSLSGQLLKSRLEIPVFSANGVITGTAHGVIK